jgi:GDP-4-dehydro-6-deoxy-D-mannose reductase
MLRLDWTIRLRALITGFGGFAGFHLAEHLLESTDWQLWGTAYFEAELSGRPERPIEARIIDLRQPDAVLDLVIECRPDYVFHLAGQAFVPEAWSDPWSTFDTNVRMQLNVLEALARLQTEVGTASRLVTITSNEVYGRVPEERQPVDEANPIRPLNPYASSKAAQDILAGQYCRSHDLDVIRIRPFNHIGPGQDRRFVAADFARQVAAIEIGAHPPVIKVGDLSAERDFSDVRDMVRGYYLAALHGGKGEVYNLGSGTSHPVREILDHYVARSPATITVEVDPDRLRPTDVSRTACNYAKARRELGWSPEMPFEQTLDDVLEDWRRRVLSGEAPSD